MLAIASGTSAAQIIAAVCSGVTAVLVAWAAISARSYAQLLRDMRDLFKEHEDHRRDEDKHTVKAIRRALTETIGKSGGRRYYDPPADDVSDET